MSLLSLLSIAVALAMDAFAVTITNSMTYNSAKLRYGVISSLSFGLAQGIMPLIGWLAGQMFLDIISKYDHYIALILLSIIGIHMIVEAVKELKEGGDTISHKKSHPTFRVIFLQAIATSIDALAVGVSFAALKINIVIASSIIAVITFIICVLGIFIGKKIGELLKGKAEIFGGIVLILIGVKTFVEHMWF